MTPRLRVLITNNTLDVPGGTEVFVRDLAQHLVRQGHWPVVYSSILGPVADELHRSTVPVISDLNALAEPPDVIHGQHHVDAMAALLRYPDVPALLMCHGWLPWEEAPPVFPSIRRYVAVDDLCRERLLTTPGVEADRVSTVYHGVDLQRFPPRGPLPEKPVSALVFSNYATDATTVAVIREACARQGIVRVDVLGQGAGTTTQTPERVLPAYDVVFAKARCALEAMAVGAAVIVADVSGVAGLVTSENVRAWRRLNFGVRTMQAMPLSVEALEHALTAYTPNGAAAVSDWVRSEANVTDVWSTLIGHYRDLVAEGSPWSPGDWRAFTSAASAYLTSLAPVLKSRHDLARQYNEVAWREVELRRLSAAEAAGRLASDAEREALRLQLGEIRASRAWRAVTAYRRWRSRLGV